MLPCEEESFILIYYEGDKLQLYKIYMFLYDTGHVTDLISRANSFPLLLLAACKFPQFVVLGNTKFAPTDDGFL